MLELYLNSIQSTEVIKAYLLQFGSFTPLAFFVLQILQVVLAPIPGGATTIIAGTLFGNFWGFVLSGGGLIIGSMIAFILGKRFGRPIVERFAKKKWIDKLERIDDQKIDIIVFLIFLFPGFPDDMICFVAGLTKMKRKTFLIACLVGRLPGVLLSVLSGSGLTKESPVQLVIITGIYVVFAAILFFNRKRLSTYINKHTHEKKDEEIKPTK